MDNQSLSYTKWKCQYHVVFISKYRRKIMYCKVKNDVREIIKTLSENKKVKITAGAVCIDHVHICLKFPPKYSMSNFMGYRREKARLWFLTGTLSSRHGETKKLGKRFICRKNRQYR